MADLLGIEIARPGTWNLASGEIEITPKMLADAADYAKRPDARPAPLKLGHTDPRFDGEPALGWLHNLRVEGSEEDASLVGDVFGMPDWLASIVEGAYPDRSMEGWSDFTASDGRKYSLVVDGLALLGVTPPGMSSLRSLRDIPQAFGVAAATRLVATIKAAAVSNRPWSDFSNSDYTDEQYARACILDRGPDAGTAKQRYSIPVREPSGTLNRNGCHAAAAALAGGRGGVSATPDQKRAAARKLASLYSRELNETPPDGLTNLAAAQQTPDADPVSENPNPGEEPAVAFSDEQLTTLRQKLGTAPDADEATILAALDQALEERADPPAAPPAPAPAVAASTPPPAPVAPETPAPGSVGHSQLPPGAVVIDQATLEALQAQGRKGDAAYAQMQQAERDRVIHAAVYDERKFAPARIDDWRKAWDNDPDGTKRTIAAMPKDLIPTEMVGQPGDPDAGGDGAEFDHIFSRPVGGSRG